MGEMIGGAGLTRAQAIDVAAQLEAEGFVALGERVIIANDREEEQSKGGIIIPDQARKRPMVGTVVSVGAEVPFDLQPGDRIAHTRFQATSIELPLLSGDTVLVQLLHYADFYVRWGRGKGGAR